VSRLPDAALHDLGLVPQALCRLSELATRMRRISTNHVLQFDTFQIAPDPFVRDGRELSVPNDQHLAWNMPQAERRSRVRYERMIGVCPTGA